MASTSNAPRSQQAPRTDDVFIFAARQFTTARPLRTIGSVQCIDQRSPVSVVSPVLAIPLGRPDPSAPPVGGRSEFVGAFTSPLQRAFRTCQPRRLRRVAA